VAALLYQQANNHWLRKLAHGREVYLIPLGDIAAVVFTTELLTQLRNRGIDLDRVSHFRARQDGKLLDKTANTKYAAQQIAEVIQGWLPARTTDPDSQHEITKLRNELAELRQCTGEDLGDTATPPRTGPLASSPASKGPTEQLHRPNTTTTIIRPFMPSGWSCHRQSLAHRPHATHLSRPSLQQMAQRPPNIRTETQGSCREHHEDGDLVVTPTG